MTFLGPRMEDCGGPRWGCPWPRTHARNSNSFKTALNSIDQGPLSLLSPQVLEPLFPVSSNPCGTHAMSDQKIDDAILPDETPQSLAVGNVYPADSCVSFEKQKTAEGDAHFHRLGWKRLTVLLTVNTVALGALGLPSAFAALGMAAGIILCVGIGLLAMYGSYLIGQVQLKYPQVSHFADVGELLLGGLGSRLVGLRFIAHLTLVVGSHCLTGSIAFDTIIQSGTCAVAFGVVSTVILFLLALPPSFTEFAILGYIDFASILLAIGCTIIAAGIQSSQGSSSTAQSGWSAWPREGLGFSEAFVSTNNIVFAYGFAIAQPSFMGEMHTPRDYMKATSVLTLIEIVIYTLTGALIYVFVGQDVQSPALLSASPVLSRVVFGLALPVTFISGSINTTVACRFIHGRIYQDSVVRYINTKKGWTTWILLVSIISVIAFIVAEAIPFFSELLSISSSLFVSGFSFYLPAAMWYCLIREGPWYCRRNILPAFGSAVLFIAGITVLVCGTYATVSQLVSSLSL